MDPYKVLGVSYDATDSEIKTKYRTLSRKYHPDANIGKPNQKELEEKFKEVQQAYNAILDERQGKTNNSEFSRGNGYYNYNTKQTQNESGDDSYLRSAANYINNGYYREGLNVLQNVSNRTGTWYYYSAWANYHLDNNKIALEHAELACKYEPNNIYFRDLYDEISGSEYRYQNMSGYYGGNPSQREYNERGPIDTCARIACFLCISSGCTRFGLPILCCL